MDAEVKKWGNSFAIRLPKSEAERLGLKEGDHIEVDLRKAKKQAKKKRVDLSGLPTFHDPDPLASEHHDEYLYGRGRGPP